MSFAFDTLSKAWAVLREKLPQDVRSSELTMRFEFLLEELHEANHRLNDAVNKDPRVTSLAVRLDRVDHKFQDSQPYGYWDVFNECLHKSKEVADKCAEGGNTIIPLYHS